ncbi:MAG: 2-hydroxyacid dehydrogenase [Gammaproteobacteria bacterium]|nr:2-hydroxyacid dehydrogenase [Gammaproteobacteria bacterium]
MSANDILLRDGFLPPPVRARLAAAFIVHDWPAASDAQEKFLAAHGKNIGAMMTTGHAGADGAMMDELPGLKLIACYGVGYDGIDVAAASARGVWVSNTPDVLNDDVADLALALMLAAVRRLPAAERYVRENQWRARGDFALTDRLTGKRLGMLGMGRIGAAIVKRALAFDMRIAYHATQPKPQSPHQWADSAAALAEWCDILCVAMPATAQTVGMVNAAVLRALGPRGYLVNIARGSLVDEAALIAALRDGVIKGAALDVFADEPHVPQELREFDNVVLSPHQGSATVHTRHRMAEVVADNIEAVLQDGEPVTAVNEPRVSSAN